MLCLGNAGLMEGRVKICNNYARFALPSVSQLGNVQFGNLGERSSLKIQLENHSLKFIVEWMMLVREFAGKKKIRPQVMTFPWVVCQL